MATASERLAAILAAHDKFRGDMSFRAEGTFEAIAAIAQAAGFGEEDRKRLYAAIVRCCSHYGEIEQIGRGVTSTLWPSNRFAAQALRALGFERPAAA